MKAFVADIFGGKSPYLLAVAVVRSYLQGWLGAFVGIPVVLNIDISTWEAAQVGGFMGVAALLHGLLQGPSVATTTTVTTSTAPVETVTSVGATVPTEPEN